MKIELFNDNFQNFKRYGIPKAQLVIADIPYNLGNNAYASNPMWYVDGDNKNGESKKAGKAFFNSDYNFNIAEYFHFCNRLLKKEPKERGQAPCMIVFCSYQQQPMVIEYAKSIGFGIINLDFSPVKGPEGNIEYLLYLQKLKEGEDFQENNVNPSEVVECSHMELDK